MSFDNYISAFRTYIDAVAAGAREAGCEAYLVGGSIRQMLTGIKPADLDFIIDSQGMAERVAQAAAKHLQGQPGVSRVNDVPTMEIRIDGLLLHIADPVTDHIEGAESIYAAISDEVKADVLRRDFTVNTLLLPVEDADLASIIDPTAIGLADIQHARLRTPVEPEVTLREDPLRMLRAIRFAYTEDYTIGADLAAAISAHAHLITGIAGERVQQEFTKIISCNQPSEAIRMMNHTALLHYLFPDIEHLSEVRQKSEHYTGDILEHTCKVLDYAPPILRVRLAALFHDVGKASTLVEDDDKTIFYGHQHSGSDLTRKRLKQLRYSNKIADEVAKLVDMHMVTYSYDWSDIAVRRLVNKAGDLIDDLMLLYRADISARTEPYNNLAEFNHLMQRIKSLDFADVIGVHSPLDGEEIMELLSLDAGPEIGEVQSEIEQAIIDGRIEYTAEGAREFLRNEYKQRK